MTAEQARALGPSDSEAASRMRETSAATTAVELLELVEDRLESSG